MGMTHEQMLSTPWHIIMTDIEMMILDEKYKPQPQIIMDSPQGK